MSISQAPQAFGSFLPASEQGRGCGAHSLACHDSRFRSSGTLLRTPGRVREGQMVEVKPGKHKRIFQIMSSDGFGSWPGPERKAAFWFFLGNNQGAASTSLYSPKLRGVAGGRPSPCF